MGLPDAVYSLGLVTGTESIVPFQLLGETGFQGPRTREYDPAEAGLRLEIRLPIPPGILEDLTGESLHVIPHPPRDGACLIGLTASEVDEAVVVEAPARPRTRAQTARPSRWAG